MTSTRTKTLHVCGDCGAEHARWAGRCTTCGGWNTLREHLPARANGHHAEVRPLCDVDLRPSPVLPTHLAELDRVLGGGLFAGSVTLLGGEPGIGKSTLLLQALASLSASGSRALLVSAEESAAQVRLRAERLGAVDPSLLVLDATQLPAILEAIDAVAPAVLVIDSIQAISDPTSPSLAGSVAQVTACAQQLVSLAKSRDLPTVLVGHVTKDGTLAGPRVLEHVVDTVLSFEGERHHQLRLLRAVKHRFGPTGELGLFEMTEDGLVGLDDPGARFLGDRRAGTPGSAVVATVDGHRPLVVEVQALVAPTQVSSPRRSAQGVDASRLVILAAVLQQRAGVALATNEIFVSAAGGARVVEPAGDLAVALAIASAASGVALPGDVAAWGEVGLGGEVRRVGREAQRLVEVARLGFRRAVVPEATADAPGVTLLRVRSLPEAIDLLGLRGAGAT